MCGTMTNGLTHMSLKSQKKKGDRSGQKKYLKRESPTISQINERQQTTDPRSSENSKQDEYKEKHTYAYHSQRTETKGRTS